MSWIERIIWGILILALMILIILVGYMVLMEIRDDMEERKRKK